MLLPLSRISRVQLCATIDGSPPGSSIHGILQARVLEWGAIAFSEESMLHENESFPGSSVVKNLPANAEDMGSIPGLEGSHMPWKI